MLNRFSTVLQSAADALAPPAPPLEDLKYHWKLVMRFYAQRSIHSKFPIEETNIPGHLEQLLRILVAEDAAARSSGETGPCTVAGPCLEYLLQHRLLELLVSLACADSPPGMRRYVLGYLRRLVSTISPYLLTQASIHLPLLRIINLCSQSRASPTEAEEIDFLVCICQIVHSNPYLSIIFNKETKAVNRTSLSSSTSSSSRNVNQIINSNPLLLGVEPDPSKTNQNSSSRTESSCGDIISQNECDPPTDTVEFKTDKNGAQNIATILPQLPNKMLEDESVGSTKDSGGSLLPSANMLIADQPSASLKDCEKFSDHKVEGSHTTTRSCTPESLIMFEGQDFQEADTDVGEGRLPLLDAVLGFINSPDSRTKLRVCEGLLMLLSVADKTFTNAVIRTSTVGLVMAEKLSSSFQEIPASVHPDDLEDIPSNWGPETSQLWLEQRSFSGSRLVASFVSWLNFCDQLTVESPVEIADSVACAVRALFFEVELESELRSGDTTRKHLITNVICICLRHLTSPALLAELNYWIVGESREPDPPELVGTSLKHLLIEHSVHSDNILSLATLRLFELLLENCSEHVLHCLVLTYFSSRSYCDFSSPREKACMDSWSDEEDAREQEREKEKEKAAASGTSSGATSLDSPLSLNRTFAPTNIHKIIDSFLQLLPSSLRSALDYEEAGYQQYLGEAQRQYSLNRHHCAPFGWTTDLLNPEDSSNSPDSRPEADHCFNEGPFLRMIFTRLRGLPQQPYEMNLQLTALVSRLAMLPHPYLHEFLLNPLLPLLPGTTSLFCTLKDVANEMQSRIASLPHSKQVLIRTRQQLLGDASHKHNVPQDGSCLLESAVVLEEFCKELAAIAYVKYHHSS